MPGIMLPEKTAKDTQHNTPISQKLPKHNQHTQNKTKPNNTHH
ncbi:hypothetical protein HmCmsJML029_03665 [Escherichia coli]|nr:hypothetical protein HmCmsJML029_03665 [Escherichia coli]